MAFSVPHPSLCQLQLPQVEALKGIQSLPLVSQWYLCILPVYVLLFQKRGFIVKANKENNVDVFCGWDPSYRVSDPYQSLYSLRHSEYAP